MAKNVNSRMRQKCDTLENWGKAPTFRPLDGEVIVISDAFTVNGIKTPGVKIGRACDGVVYAATANTSVGENFLLTELPYLNTDGRTIVRIEETETGFNLVLSDESTITLLHGKDGAPGEKGEAATITIGTVTTSDAGTNAAVINSGNENNAVFNFTIPRGADGLPGEDGAAAGFGIITATVDNITGTPSVKVTTSGDNTAKNIQFEFSGLKGAPGEEGENIDLPISKGSVDQSLVFFNQGIASGENSIVNGENSQAISKNTISIGENNIAGIKGYYWDRNNVTFNEDGTVKIPLIKDKHPTTVVGNESNIVVTELDWAVGDNISMEMESQYPFCSIIESIEDITIAFDNGLADAENATGTITTKAVVLNEVPFAEVTFISLSREVYDDYSIWAIQRTYDGTNSSITIRSGEVEFGQGAQIFGELNFGGGMNAASFGAQNAALGDNGFTCGRDNITGNAGFTCGYNNINLGFGTFVSGEENIIKGKKKADGTNEHVEGSIIAGTKNLVAIWNGAAFGRCNKANQRNSEFVIGQFNKETTLEPLFLVGNGGWGESGSGNIEGVANEIIDDGVEAPICRDNAFAVYYKGSATVGSRHTLADATGIFAAGTHNTINAANGAAFGVDNQINAENSFSTGINNIVKGLNGAAFGKDNVVKGEGCLAIGTGLEVNGPGDAPGIVIGQYNKKEQYRLFVVARGTSDTDRNNDIFTVSGWAGGGRVDVNQPLRITEIHMLKDPSDATQGNAFQITSAGNMTLSGNLTVSGTITAATWTPSEGGY